MTVAEIERIGAPQIDRATARRAFLDYKRVLLAEQDAQRRAEYAGLMQGYRAIAAGKQVIDLGQTMTAAGLQAETHYPALAVCRADAKVCHLQMQDDGRATFYADTMHSRSRVRRVELPPGTLPRYSFQWDNRGHYTRNGEEWRQTAQAVVPLVPAGILPAAHLRNYHILWDAVWTRQPPVDPLLLKYLAGSLYAIVAAWELTALEQAVLRGRL